MLCCHDSNLLSLSFLTGFERLYNRGPEGAFWFFRDMQDTLRSITHLHVQTPVSPSLRSAAARYYILPSLNPTHQNPPTLHTSSPHKLPEIAHLIIKTSKVRLKKYISRALELHQMSVLEKGSFWRDTKSKIVSHYESLGDCNSRSHGQSENIPLNLFLKLLPHGNKPTYGQLFKYN